MKKIERSHCGPNLLLKLDLKMKLSALLLIATFFTLQANTSYGQLTKITLNLNNVSIEQLLDEIEKSTEFRFIYRIEDIDLNRTVSITVKEEKITNILHRVFKGNNIGFDLRDHLVYLIEQKQSPIKPKGHTVQPQKQYNISGTVSEENGPPLPGASILEKGTTNGTQADFDGNFSIDVENEDAILVISYIGFATKEINTNGQSYFNIALKESASGLEEVIVVGYGTQRKSDVTGAVSQVKGADFVEERPVISVGQALQGVVPGLTVSKSNGIPGDGYSFNIRGYNSINGGSPLVLVDGSELDPNLIPPSDIESVTVLKDASSAAIYGARAAFGVILITTKSGQKNTKTQFTYTNILSSTRPTTFPDKVDPITQVKVGGIQWENAGRTPGWYWGRNVDTWVGLYESPNYVPNSIPVINDIAYPLGDNNNMIEYMVEPGLTLNHNLSVSGGSNSTTYFLSAGLMSQNGVLVLDKDRYNRKNVMTKVDSEVNNWLSIGATLGFTRGIQNMPYIPNNASYMYSVSYLRPTFWLTGTDEVSGAPWGFSPAMVDLGAKNTFQTNNTNVQLRASLKPFEGMNIEANYTHRSISQNDSYHVNKYPMANPTDGPGIVYYYRNDPNSLRKTAGFNNYDNLFFTGEYQKEIMDHNFKLMVGYSQEESSENSFFAQRQGLISDEVPALSLAIGNSSVGDGTTEWATRSGLYRLNYDYKGKYLLETLGRYDGSSRFEKDNRFIFSPSASVGWVVSKESFMESTNTWLNFLKLRASYGTQGNQQVGAYSYIPSMNTGTANWILNGERPLYTGPGGLVSDYYTWEKVNSINFGMDLAFFKNKLQTTLEVYERETIGMLTAGQVLPDLLGTPVPNENSADLKVNGWELSFNWADRVSDKFSYSANIILYDDKATITSYENPTGFLGSLYEGKEVGEIWGYETDRLFQETDFESVDSERQYVPGIPKQDFIFGNRIPFPGDVKYKDLNNDGVVDRGEYTLEDHGDLTIIGNSRSRYQYGIKLGAAYNNIDFSIFLQGVAKKDYWTGGAYGFTAGSQYESILSHTMDYWTPENTDAFYPRPDDRSYNKQTQTRYLLDAAYMRLKNIRIGYSLPKDVLGKVGIESIKVYFSGENLMLFSKLPQGMDPELGASHTFPLAKDLSFGTTITF